ncbi:hypothetical protein [Kitasatospora sp. NPDC088134]|uniref:hypothetical protein n=1 Tax=Kitasatospora sp. NPDC088134 TaxID=3364071 RepID=UPI00381CBD15
MRWKRAVLGLVVVVAAVGGTAGTASAEGVTTAEQSAACSKVLGALFPGLVPTSVVCKVNAAGQTG